MAKFKIKSLVIDNFKGIKHLYVPFSDKTIIDGQNATGKSTILDAVFWVMFDKLADGSQATNIRRKDANGDPVHNIDITVECTYVDEKGIELTFKKTQKEIWTKHRGSINPELEGNKNFYEINGYPVAEKKYKETISESIVEQDVYKMMSDPRFFTSLPWKQKREIVMKFWNGMSDADIAKKENRFISLVKDLEIADSVDSIKKKYARALNEYKDQQRNIPPRIDELNNMLSGIDDLDAHKKRRTELEHKISVLEHENDQMDLYKKISDLEQEKFNIQFDMNDMIRKENEGRVNALNMLTNEIADAQNDTKLNLSRIEHLEKMRKMLTDKEIMLKDELKSTASEFKRVYSSKFDKKFSFDESIYVLDDAQKYCKVCGQKLPQKTITAIAENLEKRKKANYEAAKRLYEVEKTEFEENREKQLSKLNTQGEECKERLTDLKEQINNIKSEMMSLTKKNASNEALIAKDRQKVEDMPKSADMTKNKAYMKLVAKKESIEAEVEAHREKIRNITSNTDEIVALKKELVDVNNTIAKSYKDEEIKNRIEELGAELSAVSQRAADQEKTLWLLDEFMKYKLDMISATINKQFHGVTFKLFDVQLNGGVKECCEEMYKGVPFASLNTGHRIVVGIEIIKALQKLYKVTTPIFIDNCESVNDFNLPKIDSQLIAMYVSDGKQLSVKGE